MKLLKQGICLAVVGASLSITPLVSAAADPARIAPDTRSVVQRMRDEAGGRVAVSAEPATGRVGFIRAVADTDLMPTREGDSSSDAVGKATAYVTKYASAFGATPAQLTQTDISKTRYGWTISFKQSYQGVPVFGGMLRANVDANGKLAAVNGYAAPGLAISTTPRLSAADAAARAIAAVKDDPTGQSDTEVTEVNTDGLRAASNQLMIYRLGATRGVTGKAVLAYVVEVTNNANIRDMVFVNANTDKVINRYSLVHNALERHLLEAADSADPSTFVEVWAEGDAFPGELSEWQANEVDFTGDSYWFFKNTFGRDSYDGAGHSMTTVNNDGRINCPNANWNGITTNYCDGTATDDVVAHEWGHAYTEYTDNLIYQWQPGALNESYSDIWGETIDLINGKADEEEGDITAARPAGQCSVHSPATPTVLINSPATIAKTCEAGAASFGPQLSGTGITADVVLAVDDNPADGSASNACTPLTNGAALSGKIALVDRGVCGFVVKVKNAQNAGAVAVLVADNVEATPGPLGGADPTITIPSVRIRKSDGDLIKSKLPTEPVNVTMKDAAGDRVDSYRWLMGEDATGFSGAIRDMWSPTCYGDPGKVSDAQYYCALDDSGGVHSNSGVPNHGYSLLVDGGTFNGQTVTGIGLDKAANIYYRAMTAYQTPTTDFTDHADSLASSCTDLVGLPINKVSTAADGTPVAAAPITAGDCAQVNTMTAAVELRTEPVQCNFQELLDKDTPATCGAGFKANVVWKEDFEDGLAGWTTDQEVVFEGATGLPWEASTTAPGGRAGGVAYGPGPDEGDCSGAATDISSRDSIVSPLVQLPNAALKSPRLSFAHYVATESGFDGGTVQVSINGGDFVVVPKAAYTFNAPGTLATVAQGNSNPLAGADGFTGTDGGLVTGSWGTSLVDLTKVGAAPGDTLQFRFDMGRDGCGGLDGWYVDNITVVTCKIKVKLTASHRPNPSTFGKTSNLVVQVDRDGTFGTAVTGKVTIRRPGGAIIDTAALVDGRAILTLPKRFPVGSNEVAVSYVGTPVFAEQRTVIMAKVVR